MKFLFYYKKMSRQLLYVIVISIASVKTLAVPTDSCYRLDLHLKKYSSQHIDLGHYYGNKIIFKDTILLDSEGNTCYTDIDHEGIYFLRLADSSAFEFMITGKGYYTILDDNDKINIKGNAVTEAYDQYLQQTGKIIYSIDSLKKGMESTTDIFQIQTVRQKIADYKSEINSITSGIAKKFEGSLLGSYTKAMLPVTLTTAFYGQNGHESDSMKILKSIYFFRNHYFDNIDFEMPGLIYTPIIEDRITDYLDRMIYSSPDSLFEAIDRLMTKSSQMEITQFISTILLQRYQNQRHRYLGEQAYIYIIRNYYLSDKAPWTSENDIRLLEEEMKKILTVTIGSHAPEIELTDMIGRKCSLHGIEMEYTILVFWDLACPSCKQIMQDFKNLIKKYYYIDIQIYTVYTGTDMEAWRTWNVKRLPATWINTYQDLQEPVSNTYNVTYLPAIFVLDRKKTIVRKNITITELDEFLYQNSD